MTFEGKTPSEVSIIYHASTRETRSTDTRHLHKQTHIENNETCLYSNFGHFIFSLLDSYDCVPSVKMSSTKTSA